MQIPKPKRWRSKKYLDWIRTQPCIYCGNPEVQAHHLKGIGHISGIGIKADDFFTMPLCSKCHQDVHSWGGASIQFEWIARTLGRAIEEGVLKIK